VTPTVTFISCEPDAFYPYLAVWAGGADFIEELPDISGYIKTVSGFEVYVDVDEAYVTGPTLGGRA
jgi:hypothetical protein